MPTVSARLRMRCSVSTHWSAMTSNWLPSSAAIAGSSSAPRKVLTKSRASADSATKRGRSSSRLGEARISSPSTPRPLTRCANSSTESRICSWMPRQSTLCNSSSGASSAHSRCENSGEIRSCQRQSSARSKTTCMQSFSRRSSGASGNSRSHRMRHHSEKNPVPGRMPLSVKKVMRRRLAMKCTMRARKIERNSASASRRARTSS